MGDSRLGGPSVVGKRYYDPEDKRQRRLGHAQAATGIAGTAAAASGVNSIAQDSKKARKKVANLSADRETVQRVNEELKSRKKKMHPVNAASGMTPAQRKTIFAVSGRNAALTAGGLLGVGAATQISRHANSNRGRGWN